jgi:hypothetical protein
MAHGPEHHIEHAEHAAHATHETFNKRVTISIAIIAAALACATVLGHRAHTETLRQQTLATRESIEACNKWNYYQTKNVFRLESDIMLDQLTAFGKRSDTPDVVEITKKYNDYLKKYSKERLAADMAEAEAHVKMGKHHMSEADTVHARADRFDYGDLALQLAVVLCSLSILTKSRTLWFTGMVCGAIGALITLTGVLGLWLPEHAAAVGEAVIH